MTLPRRSVRRASQPRRTPPQPLRTPDLPVVLVGTALWLIGLVVAFVRSDGLSAPEASRWFWVCVAGVFLGLVGVRTVRRRERTERDGGTATDEASGQTTPEPLT